MKKAKQRKTWRDMLVFDPSNKRKDVRKYYDEYRKHAGLPYRCDNENCPLHTGEARWDGQEILMTLDHKNGVRGDNRPKNLRYLCPNCDSLLPTRGGKNKNRIEMTSGGYSRRRDDGLRDHYSIVDSMTFTLNYSDVGSG